MGSDDLDLKGFVEFRLKGTGLTDAAAGLDDVGKTSDKAKQKLSGAEGAAKDLAQSLKTALGAAAIGALVKSSITEFAKYERGLNAIDKAAQAMGINLGGDVKRRADQFLQTLEATTGVLRQEALPVFQKFLGITKDFEGAMFATKLATDLTNAGLGDMKVNGERVANLIQGEVTEAAKSLGLQLRDVNGKVKTQSELFEELVAVYGGFGQANQDTQAGLESIGATWNEFKMSLAEGARIIIGPVAKALDFFLKAIKSIGAFMALAIGETEGFALQMADIWKDAGKDAAEGFDKGFEAVRVQVVKKEQENAEKAAAIQADKDAKAAEVKAAKDAQVADRRAAIEEAAEQKIVSARISAAKKGSDEELRLRIQLIERQRAEAILAAEEVGANIALINQAFDEEAAALKSQFDDERREKSEEDAQQARERELEGLIELLDAEMELLIEGDEGRLELLQLRLDAERELELQNKELTEREKARIEARFRAKKKKAEQEAAKAEVDLEKQKRLLQLEVQSLYAAAVMTILSSVFGQSKAMAIAETIIQTYFGAAKAIAQNPPPSPLGVAAAAFVIAQGFARVNQIRKTDFSKGKGFDDPTSDRMARLGGRRWAEDVVREITTGFGEGLSGAMARAGSGRDGGASTSSTTINEDNSLHMNIGTIFGDRASARQLVRQIQSTGFRDRRRVSDVSGGAP